MVLGTAAGLGSQEKGKQEQDMTELCNIFLEKDAQPE